MEVSPLVNSVVSRAAITVDIPLFPHSIDLDERFPGRSSPSRAVLLTGYCTHCSPGAFPTCLPADGQPAGRNAGKASRHPQSQTRCQHRQDLPKCTRGGIFSATASSRQSFPLRRRHGLPQKQPGSGWPVTSPVPSRAPNSRRSRAVAAPRLRGNPDAE